MKIHENSILGKNSDLGKTDRKFGNFKKNIYIYNKIIFKTYDAIRTAQRKETIENITTEHAHGIIN